MTSIQTNSQSKYFWKRGKTQFRFRSSCQCKIIHRLQNGVMWAGEPLTRAPNRQANDLTGRGSLRNAPGLSSTVCRRDHPSAKPRRFQDAFAKM